MLVAVHRFAQSLEESLDDRPVEGAEQADPATDDGCRNRRNRQEGIDRIRHPGEQFQKFPLPQHLGVANLEGAAGGALIDETPGQVVEHIMQGNRLARRIKLPGGEEEPLGFTR